ncbi:MAG: tRNA pseudouridine(38-40) synthase TruA [Methanophagales archaeon]|nr:tRNA pseudouridine(38-40) synthase TruA [Methanophagales archaeon]MCW3140193.1 tRNA pseudouridine(38-40) synthase TruA [Methanophagales archaeon]
MSGERIALKIGYLGTNYHGFQIQPEPELPTIEGMLFRAFTRLGLFGFESRQSANYSAAGRTDKGVHALAQVISFDTAKEVTPRMINSMLPDDIWVYAIARPYPGFNARRDAKSRKYRYFLFSEPELDVSRMKEASELLIGRHNFYNFAQGHEAESHIREIKRIELMSNGSFIVIDVEANGFLRKMVRKIVSALCMVARGDRDESWLEALLELQLKDSIEPAPPFGLVLREVVYDNIEFVEDRYAMRRIEERLKRDFVMHSTIATVLRELIPHNKN